MKLWCFDDGPGHNWGNDLAKVAQAKGIDARIFTDPHQVDEGYVFMHMHHHPSVRIHHKRIMAHLAVNPALTLIPDYRSSVLYDDKLEQSRQLARWMPRTRIFYSPSVARAYISNGKPKYPFISKSSEGASSHNVRLVQNEAEALLEVRAVFSDQGIRGRHQQTQRGYLLWQEFVEGNEGDVRIIAVGQKRLILKRGNRDDKPFASGSGRLTPIADLGGEPDLYGAFAKANEFFAGERQSWSGIDLVKEPRGEWKILECTVGWTMKGYAQCAFFNIDGTRAGDRMGSDIWEVLLNEIREGAFDA